MGSFWTAAKSEQPAQTKSGPASSASMGVGSFFRKLITTAEAPPGPRIEPSTAREVDWTLPTVPNADLWSEVKRRAANELAMRILQSEPGKLDSDDREALMRFSGWGGIEWGKISADVRPSEAWGTIAQYYTPSVMATAVWKIILRLREQGLVKERPTALEPSAGIGRFIHTAPRAVKFTAIELAGEAARMLKLLYPQMTVHNLAFEEYMAKWPPPPGGDYDLILANPPYAGRGRYLKTDRTGKDLAGKYWSEAADYFVDACAKRLRPGGIMVQLVPLGMITGRDARLREMLLRRCHFMGAYVPPARSFPGALLNLACVFVRRRPEMLDAVLESDLPILQGRYLETPDGMANVGGPWQVSTRYKSKPGEPQKKEVGGDFRPEHMVEMQFRPEPSSKTSLRRAATPVDAPKRSRGQSQPNAVAYLAMEQHDWAMEFLHVRAVGGGRYTGEWKGVNISGSLVQQRALCSCGKWIPVSAGVYEEHEVCSQSGNAVPASALRGVEIRLDSPYRLKGVGNVLSAVALDRHVRMPVDRLPVDLGSSYDWLSEQIVVKAPRGAAIKGSWRGRDWTGVILQDDIAVCPSCNRFYEQVAGRMMAHQVPDSDKTCPGSSGKAGERGIKVALDEAVPVGSRWVSWIFALRQWENQNQAEPRSKGRSSSPPSDTNLRERDLEKRGSQKQKTTERMEEKAVASSLSATMLEEAANLGRRIQAFRRALGEHPQEAEAGRTELRYDTEGWVKRYGNPHDHKAITKSTASELLALLSVVNNTGGIAPILTDGQLLDVSAFQGDRNDVVEVCLWLSGRYGQASPEAVRGLYKRTDVWGALSLHPRKGELAYEFPNVIYSWVEYVAGDLYSRLDRLTATTAQIPAWLENHYVEQRRRLIEVISPFPIEEIELDLRSGFVPVEALSDYFTDIERSQVTASLENGVLSAKNAATARVHEIVAYYNRQSKYETTGEDGAVKKASRQKGNDLEQKMAFDKAMNAAFGQWVRSHRKWSPIIQDVYNRAFRGFHPKVYSEAPLPLLRQEGRIVLKAHQNQATRRMTATRGGCIFHDVGVGKTFQTCAQVAYWRQKGICRRPLIVVPKQTLVNWGREFARLLPNYRVLLIGISSNPDGTMREDSSAVKRRKWQEFAGGQWDVAICTIPNFLDLRIRPDNEKRLFEGNPWLQKELQLQRNEESYQGRLLESLRTEAQSASEDAKEKLNARILTIEARLDPKAAIKLLLEQKAALPAKDVKKAKTLQKKIDELEKGVLPTQRKIEVARQKHEEWTQKLQFEKIKDDTIYFEDIRPDALWLDEFQNFKNLLRPGTRYGKVPKYLGSAGGAECKRCWDLWLKAALIREWNQGTGVTGLSATPFSNSPIEIFSLIQYVRPELFEQRGIKDAEAFIDRYCEIAIEDVLDTGGNIVQAPVVRGFKNILELQQLLDVIMDYRTAEDAKLKLPTAVVEVAEVDLSPPAVALYETLREEAIEAASTHSGKTEEGRHILAILDEMHKAALDVRLISERYNVEAPKFKEAARRISCEQSNCAHIMFLDSVQAHPWLRESLIKGAKCVSPERIAEISGELDLDERQQIVDGINGIWAYDEKLGREVEVVPPKYDIIIGNSPVMAEGLNLQRRACTIHHLELPWEPKTLQQRNGRGVRQGNIHPEVKIIYYRSRRSFDGYRQLLIQGKANWQQTILRGKENSINNPGAQQGISKEDLLIMLSANEDEARAKLQEKRAQKEKEVRQQRVGAALDDFHKMSSLYRSARRQADPDVRASTLTLARSISERLALTSDDVFPFKAYLSTAVDHTVYVMKTLHSAPVIFVEGKGICWMMGSRALNAMVIDLDIAGGTIRFRLKGQFVTHFYSFERLKNAQWDSNCVWDPVADGKGLAEDHQPMSPKDMESIPEEMFIAYGPRIWKSIKANSSTEGASTVVPFARNGTIEYLSWLEAKRQEAMPLWPTEGGYRQFVNTDGGTQAIRKEITRAWFKRPWRGQ